MIRREVEKRYIKNGKQTHSFSKCIKTRLSQFAENVGTDLAKHINPDCELGTKQNGNDQISFEINSSCGGYSDSIASDFKTFKGSSFATAHINGSDETFFPFGIKVEIEPFNFIKLDRRKLEAKKEEYRSRLWELPEKFKKNQKENENLKHVVDFLIDELEYGDRKIENFIDKNLSKLEKAK